MGRVPAIRDDEITLFESGAILEYVVERYGRHPAAPPNSPSRPAYLQWVDFSEATLQRPLDYVLSNEHARPEREPIASFAAEARERATHALVLVEPALPQAPCFWAQTAPEPT